MTAGEVLFSLVVFTLLYIGLGVVEMKLFLKYAKAGAEPLTYERDHPPQDDGEHADDKKLEFAY